MLLSRIQNRALSPPKRYPTPSPHVAARGLSEPSYIGSSRREQASFKIDHSVSSQEEEAMQEEETFNSPVGNTRSRRSSKASSREFSRNKADITRGKKPVGRRLELVDEDSEEEMVSPEEADQTKRGGGDLEFEKCATQNKYYKLLKRNEFLGTRYPHPETMERLGIYDDVYYMFKHCCLNIHMFQPMEGYEEETIQFLSSVEWFIYVESEARWKFGILGVLCV